MPARQVEIAGAAHTVLDSRKVRRLDPQEGLFAAMLEGWDRQQASRLLASGTRSQRADVVRRFVAFTGGVAVAVVALGRGGLDGAAAVGADAAGALDDPRLPQRGRPVLAYVTDQRYGWAKRCEQLVGTPWRCTCPTSPPSAGCRSPSSRSPQC
jgi:integrase/recombinase XerC